MGRSKITFLTVTIRVLLLFVRVLKLFKSCDEVLIGQNLNISVRITEFETVENGYLRNRKKNK